MRIRGWRPALMLSLAAASPAAGATFSFNTGETAEDRFFGVSDPGGILAIRLASTDASGGLEVDHVQFGVMVPEPTTLDMAALGLAALAFGARRP